MSRETGKRGRVRGIGCRRWEGGESVKREVKSRVSRGRERDGGREG